MGHEYAYFIKDDNTGIVLRGPYKHEETAGAVRDELEDRYPDKDWNLWVVEEEVTNG